MNTVGHGLKKCMIGYGRIFQTPNLANGSAIWIGEERCYCPWKGFRENLDRTSIKTQDSLFENIPTILKRRKMIIKNALPAQRILYGSLFVYVVESLAKSVRSWFFYRFFLKLVKNTPIREFFKRQSLVVLKAKKKNISIPWTPMNYWKAA